MKEHAWTDARKGEGDRHERVFRKTRPYHRRYERIGLTGARGIVAEGGAVAVTGMTEERLDARDDIADPAEAEALAVEIALGQARRAVAQRRLRRREPGRGDRCRVLRAGR